MELVIDEIEQEHLYVCLKEGDKPFKKQLKGAESLGLRVDQIEEQIEVNRNLRRSLNPKAEEEAREKARKDRGDDDEQMDIEDEDFASSGETGGATKLALTTPAKPNEEELQRMLRDLGYLVLTSTIGDWDDAKHKAVTDWVGSAVAAHVIGGTIPKEPDALVLASTNEEKAIEWLALGPWRPAYLHKTENDVPDSFWAAVLDGEQPGEILEYADVLTEPDAMLLAARKNIEHVRNSDMDPKDVDTWLFKGPWSVENVNDDDNPKFVIRAGDQVETLWADADFRQAAMQAARYNRNIAARAERDLPQDEIDARANAIH